MSKAINGKTKQGIQMYKWFFTFNNYTEDDLVWFRIRLGQTCKKYTFQEETGKEGTKHLQGSISLTTKARLTELKKWNDKIHWEPTKNCKAADKYCCKEETRSGRIFTHEKKRAFVRSFSKFDKLKPRDDVMEVISKEPDNRTINWFWSKEGAVGKTSTAAYLERNYEGVCIANGKGADIKNHVINYIGQGNDLDILIINVPKTAEGYVSYGAIEEIKDATIYSGKYEGGFANIEHPHVIVFANFPPDTTTMMEDRWNIVEIKKDTN